MPLNNQDKLQLHSPQLRLFNQNYTWYYICALLCTFVLFISQSVAAVNMLPFANSNQAKQENVSNNQKTNDINDIKDENTPTLNIDSEHLFGKEINNILNDSPNYVANSQSIIDEINQQYASSNIDSNVDNSSLINNSNNIQKVDHNLELLYNALTSNITPPERNSILKRIDELKDGSLSALNMTEEEKNRALKALEEELNILNKYEDLLKEASTLIDAINKVNTSIENYENELGLANQKYKQAPPNIEAKDVYQITNLIRELTHQVTLVQTKLNEASTAYNSLQTFPSRAQNQLAINNERIYNINRQLNDNSMPLLNEERQSLNFENLVLQYQNEILQYELRYITTFQDLSNYKIRILSLHKDYLNQYLLKARSKENTIVSNAVLNSTSENIDEHLQSSPQLASEIKQNIDLASHIDHVLNKSEHLRGEIQQVEVALNNVYQIEKNLQEQLSDLSGSVILSRLLSRQQGELPNISISSNLDELIPNLNLWLFDLRNHRELIFDVQSYVDELINEDIRYKEHREALIELIRHRRELLDQLYNAMASELTLAIDLRAKTTELDKSIHRVNNLINEHLFWLKSNQSLGIDFVLNFIPSLNIQWQDLKRAYSNQEHLIKTFSDFLIILTPLLLILAFFYKTQPYFARLVNTIALRLDKPQDNFTLTPLALFYHLFLIIPKVIFITILGAIVIFFSLDDFDNQWRLTLFLTLHVGCFLYMRHIMEPNSLVQRHFCVPPHIVSRNRMIIDQVWYISIPMLTIANMREIEPSKISGDIIGYSLMLLGFIYLSLFAIKTFKEQFKKSKPTLGFKVVGLICILTPLTIAIMLALGYYYTVIQLLNRVAATLYLGFAYLILSQILRRELYVAEIKMTNQARLRMRNNLDFNSSSMPFNTNVNKNNPNSFNSRNKNYNLKDNTIRLELVNSKAYKLFNAVLLTIFIYFMYLQWSDLAGVLTYLDNIYLWKEISIVSGESVILNSLSLGDILLAIIIILISFVLHKNLPTLIERLLLLRTGTTAKSTSYTVKLITSYVITALGIILSAGALGISWNNLQWLVAALSVGLGFGLQEIFANFVSGIIILFERQLRVGDIVTLNNLSGTVNKIRIRATTIESFDNKEVVIPNRQFITSALTNWSLSNTITKIEFAVGIGYNDDIALAKELLNNIVRRCRYLSREKKPKIFVKSLDASAITIMCEVYVNEIGNRKNTQDYLCTETIRLFKENDIEIPYNQVDVTIRNLDNDQVLNYSQINEIALKAAKMALNGGASGGADENSNGTLSMQIKS